MLRVRVAALAVRKEKILLARHVKANRSAFLLPGGGIEAGESAAESLVRELREEAGVESRVGDLRYVIEARSPDAKRHILQLVFAVKVEGDVGKSADTRVAECAWHPISDLRTIRMHPDAGPAIAHDLTSGGQSACRYLLAPWRE
ncbi:MAG TPA: NUDIX hydrolase [Candidatus Eremiobacteraceae bacterium]|nr:NUDIX hydrolase [Candidatus Eremiobacteraceae bacterium]